MDISLFSARYAVRQLTEADIPLIYALCSRNELFYQHCPPFVTEESIRQDMRALPPRKKMADKFYIGYFDGEKLIAVMDFIRGFPDDQTAFIGFFMVDVSVQNRGAGSAIIEDLCAYLPEAGFSFVRLGRVKGNPQPEHFWHKNGFAETGVTYDTDGYTVIMMQRALQHAQKVDSPRFPATEITSEDLYAVHARLKGRYDLQLTNSFAADDGFTEDFPIIVGQAHGMIFWMYECGGDFVMDVMDLGKTRGTHWHPPDVVSAVEDIEKFMDSKENYELSPFAQP